MNELDAWASLREEKRLIRHRPDHYSGAKTSWSRPRMCREDRVYLNLGIEFPKIDSGKLFLWTGVLLFVRGASQARVWGIVRLFHENLKTGASVVTRSPGDRGRVG